MEAVSCSFVRRYLFWLQESQAASTMATAAAAQVSHHHHYDHREDHTTIIGERRRRHRFSSFPPHPGSFNLGRKRDLYIGISFSEKLNVINNLDSGCSNDLLLTVAIELAAYDS